MTGEATSARARQAANIVSGALEAALFDMDGVVLDTAGLHAAAWKRVFDAYLASRSRSTGETFHPFDQRRDYLQHVDGRPRDEGVRIFLRSRGIELPLGHKADEAGQDTVIGLGRRKNLEFLQSLKASGLQPFPGTLRLIRLLRRAGLRVAVFSASRNASVLLRRAGLETLFDLCIDGNDLAATGLPGKPDPAMLLAAATRIGVAADRCAVIEDSIAGIVAGLRGGFAQLVGIDRGCNADALRGAGAELVVQDAAELTMENGRLAPRMLGSLPLLWERREEIRARLVASRPLVFLDYDGTLTPIVPDPARAFLSEPMREALARLARHCAVAVISGRDLEVVRTRVGIPDLIYAGSHGFEVAMAGRHCADMQMGTEFLPALDAAESALREGLSGVPGHLIERQRFAIALHYRHALPAEVRRIEAVLDAVLTQTDGLRKGAGKKVFRVQPALDWDKGRAARWIIEHQGAGEPILPVYVGDDITDEDAFRALALDGLCVAVRGEEDRPTAADLALIDTDDVHRFLLFLAESCEATRRLPG